MCGIITIVGNNTHEIKDFVLNDMLSCLSKRGPDDLGYERLSGAILGQTRLSIVDLSGGHQPMRDSEKPFTIVFNGEIYGYKDLRLKLENKGYKFSTQSDTEVILKAYSEYGEKCVDYLDGMFVFAIWDENKKELFIARDRFGKKPFYYTFINNTFFGASEIKSIFATKLIKGKISFEALDNFLRLMYIPTNETIYSNIHSFPPAHVGIVKGGKIKTWKYWELEKREIKPSYIEAKKEIKKLFDDAVKNRMIADVEVGSLLSGGVDSTIVTAYAQKHTTKKIKTFSVDYENISELKHAKTASEKIGTDHFVLKTKTADIDELKEVISYFDEPHADSSDFPQHLISKLASTKVKVVLSGDGADEIFMGYGWYQKYWNTPILKRIFDNPYSIYKKMTEVFNQKERKNLLKIENNNRNKDLNYKTNFFESFNSCLYRINNFDLNTYLPGQLLTKIDRTSMMHSLEVRCPFLDTKLVEYVYNLPIEFKVSKEKSKIILKDILEEIMPTEFVNRRKQGFGAPMKEWLTNDEVKKEINKILSNDSHIIFKYLNKPAVVKTIIEAESNPYSVQKAWSLLSLALWFELHEKDYE